LHCRPALDPNLELGKLPSEREPLEVSYPVALVVLREKLLDLVQRSLASLPSVALLLRRFLRPGLRRLLVLVVLAPQLLGEPLDPLAELHT